MSLNRKAITLIMFFLCACKVFCQVDSFVYPNNHKNNIFYEEICQLIKDKSSIKNIYLFSELDHRFKALEDARVDLLDRMNIDINLDKIYYENTFENDLLLKKYYTSKLSLSIFPDSLLQRYDNVISADIEEIASSSYNYLFKNAIANEYLDKLQGIDIGTQTIRLGLWNLCVYTKNLNLKNDPVINYFCDSIMDHYKIEYSSILESPDSDVDFNLKANRITKFMQALNKSIQDSMINITWNSVFASYFKVHANQNLSFPLILGNSRQLTSKEFAHKNSFRDSIIYGNFRKLLPKDWSNIVISFSTLHLMDMRNTKDFSDVLDSSSNTFGKYLHNDFSPYLKRVAFVCFNSNPKLKEYNNKHERESLEYKLAQKYDMVYIDLYSYAHSEGKKEPFYMRPTFFNYRKLNWEDIFDGIVFIKDCGCKLD